MADTYRGALGAFPYAYRESDSWVFKSYVLLGGLAVALVALFMLLSLIVLMGATASFEGGSLTLSRAFYILVGLLVAAPLVTPVLLVARRYRRHGRDELGAVPERYDRWLATTGYLFLATVFVALLISAPDAFEPDAGPIVAVLNAVPEIGAVVPPVGGALVMILVHRAFKTDSGRESDG